MEKFKNTYIIIPAILFSLFCSCTKEKVEDVPQVNGTKFVLETKAPAPAGTTFRIMAYGRQVDNHFSYISSGSYCFIDGKEFGGVRYLSASELDDSGTFVKEDGTKALAVPYGELYRENFFISYISPGMLHNSDGSFTVDASEPFYCSAVQDTKLTNYGVVEMSKELVDRRSKIGFRIYKDEIHFELDSFRIEGTGDRYWPASRQVTPKDGGMLLGELLRPVQDDSLLFECADTDMPFILSGIYAPKDTVSAYIQRDTMDYALGFKPHNLQDTRYLVAKFKLTMGTGSFMMEVPLSKKIMEIQPLTTYMYHITIKNTYLHTVLEICPVIDGVNSWEDVNVDFEIEDNTKIIDLGIIDIQGWEDSGWSEIEIDNPDNNQQ